jgi:gamma-butyrobetaine dioxygenase
VGTCLINISWPLTTNKVLDSYSNGDKVQIVAEDGVVVVKDNHEKDTVQGSHTLDLAEEMVLEDDNPVSRQTQKSGDSGARSFPILESEVDQHQWSATSNGSTITISSETSPAQMTLPLNWLRDNCVCPKCLQPSTQQRLHKSSDFFSSDAMVGTRAEMRTEADEVGLFVEWTGKHAYETTGSNTHVSSFYPLKKLARGLASSQYTRQDPTFFPITTWKQEGLLASPTLRVPYADFKASPTAMHAALSQVVSHGLVVLTGVPTDTTEDATCELRRAMEQIGEIRNTLYGETWDVKAIKDSKNIAYTDVDLGFHQDLL